MAKFRKKNNNKGVLKCYQSEVIIDGKTVTISFAASEYKEYEARQRHDLIADLERVNKNGRDPYAETLEKIAVFPDLEKALKDKGVLKGGATVTLKELCDKFMKYNETQGMAPSTIEQRFYTARKLCDFFGDNRKVDEITKMDAQTFDAELARQVENKRKGGEGIAPAHRSGIVKRIKTIFNWGVNNDLIKTNPFKTITAGSQKNRSRQYYITPKETALIIEACEHTANGDEWAVMCALARYQGLRVPSESRALRWSDVDFKKKEIHITAQKTKNERTMPLFDETAAILKRLQDNQKRDGTFLDSPFVLRHVRMVTNPGTTFKKIVFRAGVENYPKPFQNLRASAATDVNKKYGPTAESMWIGHGTAIAEGHYLMVDPETLERAKREGLTGEKSENDANPFDTTPASWSKEHR